MGWESYAVKGRSCVTCQYFGGMIETNTARCSHPECPPCRTQAHAGCACWTANPKVDPSLTVEQWIEQNGLPLPAFTEPVLPDEPTWKPALNREAIRQAHYQRNSTVLAWEIGRLHAKLFRIYRTVRFIEKMAMPNYPKSYLRRLRQLMEQGEPELQRFVHEGRRFPRD